jgi:hypothetical protein
VAGSSCLINPADGSTVVLDGRSGGRLIDAWLTRNGGFGAESRCSTVHLARNPVAAQVIPGGRRADHVVRSMIRTPSPVWHNMIGCTAHLPVARPVVRTRDRVAGTSPKVSPGRTGDPTGSRHLLHMMAAPPGTVTPGGYVRVRATVRSRLAGGCSGPLSCHS